MGTNTIEYTRKYYAEHKDHIKKGMERKVICENCGTVCSKRNINKHKKTQKCLKLKNINK